MKRFFAILTATLLAVSAAGAAPASLTPADVDRVALKKTARTAVEEAVAQFVEAQGSEKIKTYALFPVSRDIDDGYCTTLFGEAFTKAANKAGLELITSGSSKEFAKLLEEFAVTQDIEATIDESTKQKIGRIIDYQALLVPRIDVDASPDDTYSLKASIKVIYREAGKVRSFGSEFHEIPGKLSSSDLIRYSLWGAAGLVVLILLLMFLRAMRRAARPR